MALFPFTYFEIETKNPESGYRGQFGNSYVFTSQPNAPDQRIFNLTFPALKYYSINGSLSSSLNEENNMLALIEFYQDHKLHKSFDFEHPLYGSLKVKFNKPLVEKPAQKGSNGVVIDQEVELIEVP